MSGFPAHRSNFRQIRAFIAVAKIGSFTRAADTIGLSQPALTACIRQLEDQLGVPLVRQDHPSRRAHHVRLGFPALGRTDRQGTRQRDDVPQGYRRRTERQSIDGIDRFHRQLPSPSRSRVIQGKIPLRRSRCERGSFRGSSQEGSRERGRVRSFGHDRARPRVEAIPFFSDPIGLFCREDHPLAALDRSLQWADLSGLEILNMGHEAQIRSVAEHAPDVAILLSSTTYKVRNPHALVALLQQGNAIAAMPRLSIPDNKQEGWIFRTLGSPTLNREIFLCRHRRITLSPSAKGLIAAIRDSAEVAGATLVESVELA